MRSARKRYLTNGRNAGLLLAKLVLVWLMCAGCTASFADNSNLATVTFYVGWYSIGKAALEGLNGIYKVENGFKNSREINTVIYDPKVISIQEMEDILKKANTYLGAE